MANELVPASITKLAELGFDPIEKLVEFHDRLDLDIYHLTHDEDGEPRAKFSNLAYVGLLNLKQKIAADLLRFKYARVPAVSEVKNTGEVPITQIILDLGDDGAVTDGGK